MLGLALIFVRVVLEGAGFTHQRVAILAVNHRVSMSRRLLSLLVELGTDHEPTWAYHVWQVSLYLRVELHTKHGNFIVVERNRVFHRGRLVIGC